MKKHCHNTDAKYYKVIDSDTGERIPRVTWADDDTGEYGQIKIDEKGFIVTETFAGERNIVVETKKGNIKLVDIRNENPGAYL